MALSNWGAVLWKIAKYKIANKNEYSTACISIFNVTIAIAATATAATAIAARIITLFLSYRRYFVKRNQTFFLQSFINLSLGFKRRNSADVLFR
jgi:hypothetical protein